MAILFQNKFVSYLLFKNEEVISYCIVITATRALSRYLPSFHYCLLNVLQCHSGKLQQDDIINMDVSKSSLLAVKNSSHSKNV